VVKARIIVRSAQAYHLTTAILRFRQMGNVDQIDAPVQDTNMEIAVRSMAGVETRMTTVERDVKNCLGNAKEQVHSRALPKSPGNHPARHL
jgi:hypothetical protein